jgi:putative ABC transport system permease protein
MTLISSLREVLHEVDPSLPPPDTITVRELVSNSLSRRYFQVRLAGGFACAALALALVGIYGVVAYHVATRQMEVALRLALGATKTGVFQLLLRSGFRPVLLGLLIGLAAAVACGRIIRGMLFGVKADDPLTILLVLGLFAATAFLACLVPARRAARIEPATALKYE